MSLKSNRESEGKEEQDTQKYRRRAILETRTTRQEDTEIIPGMAAKSGVAVGPRPGSNVLYGKGDIAKPAGAVGGTVTSGKSVLVGGTPSGSNVLCGKGDTQPVASSITTSPKFPYSPDQGKSAAIPVQRIQSNADRKPVERGLAIGMKPSFLLDKGLSSLKPVSAVRETMLTQTSNRTTTVTRGLPGPDGKMRQLESSSFSAFSSVSKFGGKDGEKFTSRDVKVSSSGNSLPGTSEARQTQPANAARVVPINITRETAAKTTGDANHSSNVKLSPIAITSNPAQQSFDNHTSTMDKRNTSGRPSAFGGLKGTDDMGNKKSVPREGMVISLPEEKKAGPNDVVKKSKDLGEAGSDQEEELTLMEMAMKNKAEKEMQRKEGEKKTKKQALMAALMYRRNQNPALKKEQPPAEQETARQILAEQENVVQKLNSETAGQPLVSRTILLDSSPIPEFDEPQPSTSTAAYSPDPALDIPPPPPLPPLLTPYSSGTDYDDESVRNMESYAESDTPFYSSLYASAVSTTFPLLYEKKWDTSVFVH